MPTPEVEFFHEHATIEPLQHELTQHERHSSARLPQRVLGPTLELSPQRRFQEQACLLTGKGLELEEGAAVVLPQRRHRIMGLLTRADGQKPDRILVGDKLVHEHRRGRIEQMRVVDTQDERLLLRPLSESDLGASKHVKRGRSTSQPNRQ